MKNNDNNSSNMMKVEHSNQPYKMNSARSERGKEIEMVFSCIDTEMYVFTVGIIVYNAML